MLQMAEFLLCLTELYSIVCIQGGGKSRFRVVGVENNTITNK